MSPEKWEPLPVELWLHELRKLSDWCAEESDDGDERAIRHAFHLAALAPIGLRQLTTVTIQPEELDVLLESSALDQACRAIVGGFANPSVSKLPASDAWRATIAVAGEDLIQCDAPSAVKAQIRAWANYFTTAAGSSNQLPLRPGLKSA